MKDLMSKLSGKPDKEMDDHAEAKMQVLNELRNMAMGMMGDKVKSKLPMQVEVAAPDKAGLKKGLDLASSLVPGHDDMDAEPGMEDASEEEAAEEHDEENGMAPEDDEDDMSPEEIDSMIEELQKKKQAAALKR
ncbi:MAG: hypothetical protein H0X31_01020 [Nostocaceae cyanobacterium]|nr:hypothetical protein [Nostocaceae cyanobacterium]